MCNDFVLNENRHRNFRMFTLVKGLACYFDTDRLESLQFQKENKIFIIAKMFLSSLRKFHSSLNKWVITAR